MQKRGIIENLMKSWKTTMNSADIITSQEPISVAKSQVPQIFNLSTGKRYIHLKLLGGSAFITEILETKFQVT
jgi:hypothetical protein